MSVKNVLKNLRRLNESQSNVGDWVKKAERLVKDYPDTMFTLWIDDPDTGTIINNSKSTEEFVREYLYNPNEGDGSDYPQDYFFYEDFDEDTLDRIYAGKASDEEKQELFKYICDKLDSEGGVQGNLYLEIVTSDDPYFSISPLDKAEPWGDVGDVDDSFLDAEEVKLLKQYGLAK